ncbi:prolyl oligopeptidase family serine peptidase [Pelomonas sp. CA6]|nr:prolyl oligopeptidase family serine peptidase [Pelomonas sp. CA6]
MAWVRERNARSEALLRATPGFERLRGELLERLNDSRRIPHIARRGDWFYNLWQDEAHPRGLWRRCTLESYREDRPDWHTVLDLDALGAAEGRSWVFDGADALAPAYRRCLLALSDGGADAHELREFDLLECRFIPPEEGGFFVPEAKTEAEWLDEDTLLIGTELDEDSLTDSGYPRQIRRWRRGTPLAAAPVIFEGEAEDVAVSASVDRTPGHERVMLHRALDFYNDEHHLLQPDGQLRRLDLPSSVELGLHRQWMLLSPREDWTVGGHTHPAGSLLLIELEAFLAGDRALQPLFTPDAARSLADYSLTRDHLLLHVSEHVASRLEEWDLAATPPRRRDVAAPFPGLLSVQPLHDPELAEDALAEDYLLHYEDFLTPDSVSLARGGSDERIPLKAQPPQFDASGLAVRQHFAVSADGTRVPYFLVGPAAPDHAAPGPTLLYGYGGFEVALQPWYLGGMGQAWLARGGRLVVANIRGGGEYGPAWHQAAQGRERQRSFDDFIAVAEQLLARGLCRPDQLGLMGGSNGGLLVAACALQRPELFGAVVCQVPLLDMRRYHQLLAGASWMAEYGDPDDPEDWAVLRRYSPYHQLRPGRALPSMLLTTSTRDDRVHPGHARKFVARMEALGHAPLYVEALEGGHGGAADNLQRADLQALEYSYLARRLGLALEPH